MSHEVIPPNLSHISDLKSLIEQARQFVSSTANSTLTMLYWKMGERIQREILADGHAEYGEKIVSTLSTLLVSEYGEAFGLRGLRRMVQFSVALPDEKIVATIELESLRRAFTSQTTLRARLLRRDVPH